MQLTFYSNVLDLRDQKCSGTMSFLILINFGQIQRTRVCESLILKIDKTIRLMKEKNLLQIMAIWI